MPPTTTKAAATIPATAIIHWIALVTMVAGFAQAEVAQLVLSLKLTPIAARMEFKMTLASRTIARPMKA